MKAVMSDSTFQMNFEKVKRLTHEASERVNELVFSYGHLEEGSFERKILESKVKQVLSDWSDQIWDCGAEPRELWSVVFKTSEGDFHWQLPCSQLMEMRP